MAAKDILNWLEFDRHSDHKHTFKVLREQDLWPKDIQKGLQKFFEKKRECRHEAQQELKDAAKAKVQNHSHNKPEYQTITYERYQSFEEVDKQLKERIFELATEVLGNPTSRTSTQLRFGKKGSICVFTNGPKQGLYANHETGVYGGPLKLIEEQAGLSSTKDSLKWASEWLGGNPLVIEQRVVEKSQNIRQQSTWTPITPVPKEAGAPDIEGNKYLNYMLKDGAKETHRHAYRDEAGNLKGYVFRIEKEDGSKITPPLAYCENEKGFRAWKWAGFEKEGKTPYGIEKLAQYPTKPILVVEGEKTADAAQKLLLEYNVLTWIGGAGNVGKTNWDCLSGREVVIWPDHDYDQGGQKAAQNLQKIVTQLNKETGKEGSVGILNLPEYLPNNWDLADKLPSGWTLDTVKEMIRDVFPSKDKKVVLEQKITEAVSTSQKSSIVNIEKAANQFIDLCVLYEGLSWNDPNDTKTLRKIEAVAGKYMHNEEFRQRIASSENEIAINRFQIEIEEQMPSLKDTKNSGITNDISLSQGESSGNAISEVKKTDINIEKAVNQFIDLCVLYESLSWDDPNDTKTLRKIEAVSSKYMNNEEFKQRIEASKSEAAINRLQSEMEEQKQNLSRGISI